MDKQIGLLWIEKVAWGEGLKFQWQEKLPVDGGGSPLSLTVAHR